MDFRTCPACQASVLEDDAQDCPFCGASMSGKPQPAAKKPAASTGKPAAPAARPGTSPAKPGAAASRPPASAPAARTPSGRAAAAADNKEIDDPFEIDTSAVRRAVKLAPKPTKSRTVEVVCPMCETRGFMAPQEAGRDVTCCNPECIVPVFKSPRLQKVEEKVEETSSHKALLIGSGAAALVVVLGAIYAFTRPSPELAPAGPDVASGPAADTDEPSLNPVNEVVDTTAGPPATFDEIRKQSLTAVVEKARARDRNRNQGYGLQLAAEALAEAGQIKGAQEQLQRLQAVEKDAPYFQIQPLVEIGWQQLSKGQADAAGKSANDALKRAKGLPKSVRKSLDAATSLAALLIALDRQQEALDLIQTETDANPRGEMSVLWRAAIEGRTFDVDVEAQRPWHLAMPDPMHVGVVETLVSRGRGDQAKTFLQSIPDTSTLDACRAAWAGRLTLLKRDAAQAEIDALLESGNVSPVGKCRVRAAVANAWQSLGESAQANASLEQAVAALAAIPEPRPLPTPSKKQVWESEGKKFAGLADPSPQRSAALAAADVALVQLAAGQREEAWDSFQKALAHSRAFAPSTAAVKALFEELTKQEPAVRAELNAQLKLGNDEDKIRRAFARYRNQARFLEEEAKARMTLQLALLRAAARNGLAKEVWGLARDRSQRSVPSEQELYFDTNLPGLIEVLAGLTADRELVSAVAADLGDKKPEADPLDKYEAAISRLVADGKLKEASDAIQQLYRSDLAKRNPDRADKLALRMVSQVQRKHDVSATLNFIKNLYDPTVKEDACQLFAAESVGRGHAPELWKAAANTRELDALELAALYRGFIAGLARPPAANPAIPAESTAANVSR